ncbi:MAG: ABC transporter substrate-binding protein [Acidimicrobiia bacterium]
MIAVAGVGALALGACGGSSGGGGSSSGSGKTGGSASDASLCPVGALAKAKAPVTITFWHGLSKQNEAVLQGLVDTYNAKQPKVKVDLVNQNGYEDILRKWVQGLSTGDLPDVGQLEDTATQQMIDTRSIVPAAACVAADHFDTSSILPRVLERYTVNGTLYPMPFNVSNPVLYFDQNAFTAAGLDPTKPPTTLAAVKDAAAKIKAAGYQTGLGLKINPWYLEQWAAKGDSLYVDHQNGRKGRATKATFGDAAGRSAFAWMKDLVDSGLARTNPDSGPNSLDNLLGIASKVDGMTIDTSAALGEISQVLQSGEAGHVKLGVGPLPGPSGSGGVLVGGGALYMSKKSSPEKIAATWDFLKFLVQADSQATFAAGTGYVPINKDSPKQRVLADQWAKEPGYKVAYDQLLVGKDDIATAGPVIGDYAGVRDVVRDVMTQMLTGGMDATTALHKAVAESNAKIEGYNRRVGA